jgi:mannitol/fructose-specific phosphotransferase system IIA component (Ntr-type)
MTTTTSITRALADYTAPAFIIPRLQACTMREVMRELSQTLRETIHALPELDADSSAALQRELLTGVDLTTGAVFPRVRVAGLQCPRFALGRAGEPCQWLARFYPPTDLVFLIAEPNVSTPESDRLVETLTRLRRDQVILNELRLARTAEEMLIALGRFPLVSAEELALAQAHRLQHVSHYASNISARGQTRRR